MKKITLILGLLPCVVFAQTKVFIVDSSTKMPVKYAEVYVHNAEKYMLADSLGVITLSEKEAKEKITVSCLGFKAKTLATNDIQDTVLLFSKKNKLDKVVIRSSGKEVQYGFVNSPTYFFFPKAKVNKRFYPAVYIKNPSPDVLSYINTVSARIRSTDRHKKGKIRLHIYEFDPDTETIGQELLRENLIFTIGTTPKIKAFPLNKRLKLPKNGVLVALQLVNDAAVIIRCGKDKSLETVHSFTVPGFKLKNSGVSLKKVHQLRIAKKYPLMIGITVERF